MHEIAHNTIKPSDVTITTKSQEFSSFSLLLRPVNCLPTEFHGSIAHCNSPGGRADARAPARRINVHSLLEETPLLPVRQKRSTYKCGLFDSCTKCEETACYSDRIVRSKEYIEPVSALDPIGRKDVLELLAKLKGQSTVFFSSHILTDVDRICDEGAVLDHGKLLAQSPTQALKEQYAQPIITIELETDANVLESLLKQESYVQNVEVKGAEARVLVTDLTIAKRCLPECLINAHLPLLRYEVTLPTLEDVFIRLIDEDTARLGGR
jgi:hypothetical protein